MSASESPRLLPATGTLAAGDATQIGTILLVGLGSIGNRHLGNLRALGHDDVVLHRSGAGRLAATAHDLGFGELRASLKCQPHAVIVANPTSMHVATALEAARFGAHLFIEKPLASSREGVEELVALSEDRSLVVQAGFQFRFHPTLRVVKAWLEGGAIGPVVRAHAHWGECLQDWHPWEDYRLSYSARRRLGGGVLHTLSHPFDYLRWLLGDVSSVYAEVRRLSGLELDVEDTALVTLGFVSGAVASVSLDYVERPISHRLEILGQRGAIRWNATTGRAELRRNASTRIQSASVPVHFERNSLFVQEMRHFLECLATGSKPACSLPDAIHALDVSLAAHRSAEEGRRVLL